MDTPKVSRPTYHHGDLRNALITAGAKLAERGGLEAIGVRAAARAVGVTPTAAYRHFASAEQLIHAVKARALEILTTAMNRQLATIDAGGDASQIAIKRLEGIGHAYIRVGLSEPGLYRVAFGPYRSADGQGPPEAQAFEILLGALDDLVLTGLMPASHRPLAEAAVWGAVHGLVSLINDGRLGSLPDEAIDLVMRRCVDMVLYGFVRQDYPGDHGPMVDGAELDVPAAHRPDDKSKTLEIGNFPGAAHSTEPGPEVA